MLKALLDNITGTEFEGRVLRMEDKDIKEEEQFPEGNRGSVVGWGWVSVRCLGLDDPGVDMMEGREVGISS